MLNGGMISVAEAAARLGKAESTVRKWCATLGYTKIGRMYILTDEQVAEIAMMIQNGPGRPRGK